MTERLYSESEVRELMAAAWSDGNDKWHRRPMAERTLAIERILRDHAPTSEAAPKEGMGLSGHLVGDIRGDWRGAQVSDDLKRPIGLPESPMLRAPVSREDGEQRAKLIERAIRMREEIEIELNTVRHWNEHVRRPGEAEIDADPKGEYAEMLRYLTKLIDGAVA